MNSKKNRKNGFTLVEMLIVIVIIGILAAALIPKLQSARGKANDVARKANLNQVATALMSYNIDKGTFPNTGSVALSDITEQLTYAGMSSIPKDPEASKVFNGMDQNCNSSGESKAGEFMYTIATKGAIPNSSYILMAGADTDGGANYIRSDDNDTLCRNTDVTNKDHITRCDGNCTKTGDNLRYIVTY